MQKSKYMKIDNEKITAWVIFAIAATFIVLSLVGCRSKKITTEKETTVKTDTVYINRNTTDTIIITKEKEITKPVYFETKIPCDQDTSGKVGTGNNYTEYEVKDGQVYLKTNLDSVSNVYRDKYRSKFIHDSISIRKYLQRDYDSQERIKTFVYPWWIYLLGGGLIIFVFLWVYEKFFKPF